MRRIGTELPLTEEDNKKLRDALSYWHRQITEENVLSNRRENERAFYCKWEGQNASGVRKDKDNELAWPFDGASDQRLRWGDAIFQKKLALILIAVSSCEVELTCGGSPEEIDRAKALKLLLNASMNALGAKGYAEIMAMFHYMMVDTPAVAALEVLWKKRLTNGVMQVSVDELQEEYAATMANLGEAPTEAAADFMLAVSGEGNPEIVLKVANWLVSTKKIRQKDVYAVMQALAEDGECECLTVVDQSEGPELDALRYGDDFCIPTITDDFDYASPWFRGEWVTESQLKERIADQGWDLEWVNETLEHKGIDFFHEEGCVNPEDVKDLCNICWCYTAETDDNGVTTRYVSVIGHADGSAFGKRVLRSRRGKWNTTFFRREVRNSNILDCRGIAEISAPAQGVAKAVRDGAANNAIVGSLPPVKAKGARVRNVLLEPFGVINMGANDDVTFMQPPAYPAAADKAEEKIKNELLDYLGVTNGQSDVTEARRHETEWMLKQWRDFLIMLLEVTQDNASDEFVMRATGSADTKGVKAQDVAGTFSITLKLDPTNLDNAKLIEKVNAMGQIIQNIDRKGTVDTDPFVRHAMTMLFPEMAGTALKPAEQLAQEDIRDEQDNFVKIKAGIMPTMDTDGRWNYAARLQFYQQMQQENPDAIAEMSPRSQEMLQQWIAALQQQQTQFGENAQIGRTGVQGVGAM